MFGTRTRQKSAHTFSIAHDTLACDILHFVAYVTWLEGGRERKGRGVGGGGGARRNVDDSHKVNEEEEEKMMMMMK